LLGGNVYVKSRPGIGSTFFAVIPLRFSGEMEVVQIPEAKHELDPGKLPVLVVEDNREAIFIYEKYLKDTRYQVVQARNLKEARETLRSMQPAAIILDVLLQGEHSWELLVDLKQSLATKDIPVLVVTVVDNRDRATALGADGFHPKPVERVWLLEQLDYFATLSPVKRVLVIDDDEVSRYLVKTVLGHSNFRVAEASGGKEGIRKAQLEKPDVVMLDLSMPDLSGFEVLDMLKKDARTASIPVIIHTSKSLDSQDYVLLHEAAAVLNKASSSQEISIAHFAEAFRKAGFPIPPSQDEVNHV